MADDRPLATTVSVDYKINLGNYESASVFVSVSNVTMDTMPDELDDILIQSKLVYSKIIEKVRERAAQIRGGVLEED